MPDPTTLPSSRPLFVAVGYDGLRMTSENGTDWKNISVGKEGQVYRTAAFGNGLFVAAGSFGGQNIIASTRDGVEWSSASKDAQYKNYIRSLGFGAGKFLGLGGDPGSVGSSSPIACTSTDGVNWTKFVDLKGTNILRRFAYGPSAGLFVGVGDRGRRAASTDGLDWKDAPDVKPIDTLVDVAFGTPGGAGIFVGVGLHSLRMTTTDGIHWSDPIRGEEGEHLNTVVWTGDRFGFVAAGPDVSYFSPDGVKWQRTAVENGPLTMAYGVANDAGIFVGNRWKGRVVMSTDAVHWREVYKGEHHVEALCAGT